jgi:hypothetical protein
MGNRLPQVPQIAMFWKILALPTRSQRTVAWPESSALRSHRRHIDRLEFTTWAGRTEAPKANRRTPDSVTGNAWSTHCSDSSNFYLWNKPDEPAKWREKMIAEAEKALGMSKQLSVGDFSAVELHV